MHRVPSQNGYPSPTPRRAGRHRSGRALFVALAAASIALLAACTPLRQPLGADPGPAKLASSWWRTPDGVRLPVRIWRPKGPVRAIIVGLHGFNDYSYGFDAPARELARSGIMTYAYDQRGFGQSPHRGIWPGSRVLVRDADDFVRLVESRHPHLPVYLMGESMGGAVAVVAMSEGDPPPVAGVILAAPAVWSRGDMAWYQRALLTVADTVVPGWKLTGHGLDVYASDNLAMLDALGRDPLVIKGTRVDTIKGLVDLMDRAQADGRRFLPRALILYGRHDALIPPRAMAAWVKSLPASARARQTIAFYPDGWHMLLRDFEADTVLGDIKSWIFDPQAPLPSHADRGGTKAVLTLAAERG